MKNTKKVVSIVLVLLLSLGLFTACGKKDDGGKADVEMKKISAEDVKADMDKYLLLDLRKAADYDEKHIPGAVSADLDVVVSGNDAAKGKEVIKKAIEGNEKPIVLVCYSGARYAQAGTNALSELGAKMDDVFTLEGGMKAWTEAYPEDVE